jgi:ribonuclease E
MVDDTNADNVGGTAAPSPRPRRRAAQRPAGPPPPVEASDSTPPAGGGDAGPAPRKRASRAKKAPEAGPEAPAAGEASGEPVAPARARRTTAKTETTAKTKAGAKTKASVKTEAAAAGAAPAEVPAADAADATAAKPARAPRRSSRAAATAEAEGAASAEPTAAPEPGAKPTRTRAPRSRKAAGSGSAADEVTPGTAEAEGATTGSDDEAQEGSAGGESSGSARRRRRRGGRRRRGSGEQREADESGGDSDEAGEDDAESDGDQAGETSTSSRRRRRRRRRGSDGGEGSDDDPPQTVTRVREPRSESVTSVSGSTRLEAKRQRRREGRDFGRRRAPILTEAEFLARREAVERTMLVRQAAGRTQIAVLEDGVLVEHYVNREGGASMVGNVYLGRVQNVLPSMEAAFVDVGRGRNAVLYAGEVNWDAAGLEGQPRRIELALKSGDPVLVQVTKDPVGQKGSRLTSQISLPGRFVVYVPDGSVTGISRKLPEQERHRLKAILKKALPEGAGVIVRTAAEGASEADIIRDVETLQAQWETITAKAATASPPSLLYGEPDLAIKVARDIFNEDVTRLIVAGADASEQLRSYVASVAPDLLDRVETWVEQGDLFAHYRVTEQLAKALDRKVWLPSGGSLVIDRTEAMTVVDVNTGKFTGQGGNLEETVTRNNLEAAEEIARQLRLRDIGGIIVVDFIDMVLESNRDLVLRRLVECLARDRTKHQVAEVTSLGLVQMTRKRIGQGLLEAFSETCSACGGRGIHVHLDAEGSKPKRGVDPAEVAARAIRLESEPAAEEIEAIEVPDGVEVPGVLDLEDPVEPLEPLEPLDVPGDLAASPGTDGYPDTAPPAAHDPGLTPPGLDPVP